MVLLNSDRDGLFSELAGTPRLILCGGRGQLFDPDFCLSELFLPRDFCLCASVSPCILFERSSGPVVVLWVTERRNYVFQHMCHFGSDFFLVLEGSELQFRLFFKDTFCSWFGRVPGSFSPESG